MFTSRIFSRWSVRVCGGQNSDRVYVSPRGNIAAFTHHADREENEDGFLVRQFPATVLAVADGLTCWPGSGKASAAALESLQRNSFLGQPLSECASLANAKIIKKHNGTATTFVAVRVKRNKVKEVVSCGDSRAFLFPKEGEALLLTRDQNDFSDRFQAEHPSEPALFPLSNPEEYYERSRTFRGDSSLFSCLGIEKPELFYLGGKNGVPLRYGDQLLLCTDGLHRFLPYRLLRAVVDSGRTPEDIVNELFERALAIMQAQESEGDNIAIVLYRQIQ